MLVHASVDVSDQAMAKGAERGDIDRLSQPGCGGLHRRGVERGRDPEGDDALCPDVLQIVGGACELGTGSGHDDLPRRVVVRDDDVRSDERTRDGVRVESDDRGHRSRGIRGLHELAACPDQSHRIRKVERAARDERTEFSKRVAENHHRLRQ